MDLPDDSDQRSDTNGVLRRFCLKMGGLSALFFLGNLGRTTAQSSTQTPYLGSNHSIPGRIQAEQFDEDGRGVAYEDTTSKNRGGAFRKDESVDVEMTKDRATRYDVGYIEDGEYLEYTVDVSPGVYDIDLRVASPKGEGQIEISMDGATIAATDVPETGGWQQWTTVTVPEVSLDGGNGRLLRLTFLDGGFNINWIQFMGGTASSGTSTAITDGGWNDPNTWERRVVPADDSDVLIQDDVTVTLGGETNRIQHLLVEGTLRHDPTRDSLLHAETVETTVTGRYEMGTESAPLDPDTTAELEFVDFGPIDESRWPNRRNKGLIGPGEVEIVGAEKTSWTTLATHATAGDSTLELTGEPTNWSAGDRIVVPGLTPYASELLDHEDETRTIASVSGTTVAFETPLEYDHVPPAADLDSYVLNLSRNARFYSESQDASRYGHLMLQAAGQTISYLELVNIGRTDKGRDVTAPLWGRGEADPVSPPNPRGRYAIHSHHTGPTNEPHRITGCSVRDNPGWGIVNHDSNLIATDNVTYNIKGAGLVTERGNEAGAFRRNFALRSAGSGEQVGSRKGWNNGQPTLPEEPPHNIDDFGHNGVGFWIHSPIVEVEDNVAAGHRSHGFIFFFRSLYEQVLDDGEALDGKHDNFPDLPRELLTANEQVFGRDASGESVMGTEFHTKDDALFFSQTCRLRQFANNECFGSGAGCSFRSVSYRNVQDRPDWAEPTNFTAYNIGPHYLEDGTRQGQHVNFESSGNVGLDHRYVGNLGHTGHRLVGTGGGVGSNVNGSYTNGFDLDNCSIENFELGFKAKTYNDPGFNYVTNCTFDNETDIFLKDGFPDNKSGLYLDGNSYNGTNRLEWEELLESGMNPRRFLNARQVHSTRVLFENRTLYHGWSDPEFIICHADDTERLETMMRWEDEWRDALGGDDPRTVLPGTTLQELYDQYGLTFYGAVQDPSQPGFDQPDDLVGSGSRYDSTPFLGPESKPMPTDEIWADPRQMDRSGAATLVDADSHPSLAGAIGMSNSDTLLELEKSSRRSEVPQPGEDGICSYSFDIDTDGPYQLYLRCLVEHRDDTRDAKRRVYYRLNGGSWTGSTEAHTSGETGLTWLRLSLSEELVAANNSQTIEIAPYDPRLTVFADWFMLNHKTVGAPPMGRGKPATPR